MSFLVGDSGVEEILVKDPESNAPEITVCFTNGVRQPYTHEALISRAQRFKGGDDAKITMAALLFILWKNQTQYAEVCKAINTDRHAQNVCATGSEGMVNQIRDERMSKAFARVSQNDTGAFVLNHNNAVEDEIIPLGRIPVIAA